MSVPRKHHFIPAFYLGQWCDRSGKVVEYSIKHNTLIAKPVGPGATGFDYDLYAFDELPPEQSQFIEQKFFDFADRMASAALERLIAGDLKGWTSEQVSAWSRYVVALCLRHPDTMPELRTAAKAIWEGSGESSQRQYELIKEAGDPPTLDEYLARIDSLAPIKARVDLIVAMFDNPVLGQHINGMIWSVLDVSAAPHFLLTSDRPVTLYKLNEADGMVWLPISPTKLFVAVNEQWALDRLRRQRPRELVAKANEHVVALARHFVWSLGESQTHFIERHMSKRLEPTPFFPTLARWQDDPRRP